MVHHLVFGKIKHHDNLAQSWQEQEIKHTKHIILQQETSTLHNSWFSTIIHQEF